MIKLYVEIKGVDVAMRELRQTNMMGFFGKRGQGVEMPRCDFGRMEKVDRKAKGKKKRKSKSSVVLRKGGFEVVASEGGTVRWGFITG